MSVDARQLKQREAFEALSEWESATFSHIVTVLLICSAQDRPFCVDKPELRVVGSHPTYSILLRIESCIALLNADIAL